MVRDTNVKQLVNGMETRVKFEMFGAFFISYSENVNATNVIQFPAMACQRDSGIRGWYSWSFTLPHR
jgi:hypothetical protein